MDANKNGMLDSGERTALTDANGNYTFSNLAPGAYTIREVTSTAARQTVPANNAARIENIAVGQNLTGADFGVQQLFLYSLTVITPNNTVFGPLPAAINDSGQVAGTFGDTIDFRGHAFLYSGGKLTDLGTLGGPRSSANGINNSGQIVGYSDLPPTTTDRPIHGFLYSNGRMTDLGLLNGSATTANAINNAGQIVGNSYIDRSGSFTDLGDSVVADAINNNGDYGGAVWASQGPKAAGTYSAFVDIRGKMIDLSTLGAVDDNSSVVSMNDLGQAVGNTNVDFGPFLYSGGVRQPIAGPYDNLFPGSNRIQDSVSGINNAGQIVGTTSGLNEYPTSAFIITGGRSVDLNDALTPATAAAYHLSYAYAINNNGWIVAEATNPNTVSNDGDIVLLKPLYGSVTGNVFNDANGDGIRQSNEPGTPGIRVYADLNGNRKYDPGEPSAVTDSAGNYTISGLSAGGYVIREVVAPGAVQTTPSQGWGIWAPLAAGQNQTLQAFGQAKSTGSVTGVVFRDANGDGIRESNEAGLPGVRVYADLNGNRTYDPGEPSAITDSSGNYTISGLAAGGYVIREVVAAGAVQTTPSKGWGIWAPLLAGQNKTLQPFGQTPSGASVNGTVFLDGNGDGARQTGEVGLAGIRVYADLNGSRAYDAGEPSALTDATGKYTIAGLAPGAYVIREVVPAGHKQTTPRNGYGLWAPLTAGQNEVLTPFGQV